MLDPRAASLQAARAQATGVDADAYARSRNHLDGAVSQLSPFITHGLIRLPEVYHLAGTRRPLRREDMFVYELGWRAYFRHVWAQRGEAIWSSLHPGPLPDAAYRRELPTDVLEGRTGLPVIDRAVHTLYTTGLLHNHARMWLASYCVHLRKIHWRCGADWMVAHLLDGDLASNHLSWQWVAGTASRKPYLFTAENVARHAPPDWHSPGSVLDATLPALDRCARDASAVAPRGGSLFGMDPPRLSTLPPAGLRGWPRAESPKAHQVRGRHVRLRHAWDLGDTPDDGRLLLTVFSSDFHARWPWARQRWAWVGARLSEMPGLAWWGSEAEIAAALAEAASVDAVHDFHLGDALQRWTRGHCRPEPALFSAVDAECPSFSAWWRQTRLIPPSLEDLS